MNAGGVKPVAPPVLDAWAEYPTSMLADLYDPLTIPAPLLKTHKQPDRAMVRCYRPESFPSDRRRVEYLFALYEQFATPLGRRSQDDPGGVEDVNDVITHEPAPPSPASFNPCHLIPDRFLAWPRLASPKVALAAGLDCGWRF